MPKIIKQPNKEVIDVGKNLTRKDAIRLGTKKIKGDRRGASYNPKTGKITFI